MNWNKRVRQSHRWISLAFTLAVVGVVVVVATQEEPAEWVFVSPLLPLALLMLTGLYLFALPFVTGRRRHPPASGADLEDRRPRNS
jgi:hypothetical protein